MAELMEAPVEGAVEEWQEGMEAAGPLPLQTLEVRVLALYARATLDHAHPRGTRQSRHPPFQNLSLSRSSPLPLAQEHGVAASDIKKLLEAGIHTVEGLAHASKKSLKDIKGLSEMKVEKLKAAGARPPPPFAERSSLKSWHPVSRLTPPRPLPSPCSPESRAPRFHDGVHGAGYPPGYHHDHHRGVKARRASRGGFRVWLAD